MNKNHINIPDDNGDVYCHRTGEIAPLSEEHLGELCTTCPFFNGTAQGNGIECYWNDVRKDIQDPHVVYDPLDEKRSIKIAERKGR